MWMWRQSDTSFVLHSRLIHYDHWLPMNDAHCSQSDRGFAVSAFLRISLSNNIDWPYLCRWSDVLALLDHRQSNCRHWFVLPSDRYSSSMPNYSCHFLRPHCCRHCWCCCVHYRNDCPPMTVTICRTHGWAGHANGTMWFCWDNGMHCEPLQSPMALWYRTPHVSHSWMNWVWYSAGYWLIFDSCVWLRSVLLCLILICLVFAVLSPMTTLMMMMELWMFVVCLFYLYRPHKRRTPYAREVYLSSNCGCWSSSWWLMH